jgi:hypothetical protein
MSAGADDCENLQVLEDRVREFHARFPSLTVQQFDLRTAPERFDHGVFVAVPDRTHQIARWVKVQDVN